MDKLGEDFAKSPLAEVNLALGAGENWKLQCPGWWACVFLQVFLTGIWLMGFL